VKKTTIPLLRVKKVAKKKWLKVETTCITSDIRERITDVQKRIKFDYTNMLWKLCFLYLGPGHLRLLQRHLPGGEEGLVLVGTHPEIRHERQPILTKCIAIFLSHTSLTYDHYYSIAPMTGIQAERAGVQALRLPFVAQVLLNVLTWTQGRSQVAWVGVGGVLDPAVQVLHDPVQPASQVVFGPALDVVQVQLLGAFLLGG